MSPEAVASLDPKLVDSVAQALQDYNALVQCAQCLAAGHQVPDMTQFKIWAKLTEEERDYIRPIARVAIKARDIYPLQIEQGDLLRCFDPTPAKG